jgi:hypothetical protein
VTIQDLGSIGELVAALATVATLAYLALQIRQNTEVLGHTAERAALDDANKWRDNLIQHPDLAELYRRGLLGPESLDRSEKLRFRMLLDSLFDTWQYQFRSGAFQGGDGVRYIRDTLALPGGAQYWAKERDRFAPEFVEAVNEWVHTDRAATDSQTAAQQADETDVE